MKIFLLCFLWFIVSQIKNKLQLQPHCNYIKSIKITARGRNVPPEKVYFYS